MKHNFLERAIRAVSPGWAASRAQARAKVTAYDEAVRRYEAASMGRRTEGWRTAPTGANSETRAGIRLLRDRSRDLVRNNPYAKRAVQIIKTNVVGAGIRPAALGTAKLVKKANPLWLGWANSTACDFDGRHNFAGLQRLAMAAVAESGEVIILRKRLTPEQTRRYGGVGIQLQVLEADYIDSNRDNAHGEDGGRIIQGVEFDRTGRRVAYWLHPFHPGEATPWGGNTSVRVPAEDVLHVYEVLRPGQVRGVPFGVSAMLRLRDFDDYEDAQLMRQKIAACFSIFYYGAEALEGVAADNANGTDDPVPDRVEPGTIQKLPAGSSVEMATPPAAEGYADYSRTVLRSVAAGYGVTYEQLTGDLSNVNFTSARMGRLEFEAYVSELQDSLMIVQFCGKIWEWFATSAYANGAIDSPTVGVKWTVPARKLIDPVKEVKAFRDAVRAGFMSYSDAVLALGNNPEELIEALKADNKAIDTAGLSLTSDPRKYGDNGTPVEKNPAPEGKSNL